MRPSDMVGVLLGDLLDVDAAQVGEQHHRPLAGAVPDHARVVLVGNLGAGVDQHAARHVAVDLQRQHGLGVGGGLIGRVGELHAACLHPSAGQHLGLDHHRTTDLGGDLPGLIGAGGEAVLGHRDSRLGDDGARLVLEETHRRRGTLAIERRSGPLDGGRRRRRHDREPELNQIRLVSRVRCNIVKLNRLSQV